MQIRIVDDGNPIYRQIQEQIRDRILCGVLSGGDELPPIRTLALRLAVNPNTVARAYRELEVEGLVEKRRTTGTFVSHAAASESLSARRRRLREPIDALIAQARGLGFNVNELIEEIRRREPTKEGEPK
jgi:GntR family transcriptional regulator